MAAAGRVLFRSAESLGCRFWIRLHRRKAVPRRDDCLDERPLHGRQFFDVSVHQAEHHPDPVVAKTHDDEVHCLDQLRSEPSGPGTGSRAGPQPAPARSPAAFTPGCIRKHAYASCSPLRMALAAPAASLGKAFEIPIRRWLAAVTVSLNGDLMPMPTLPIAAPAIAPPHDSDTTGKARRCRVPGNFSCSGTATGRRETADRRGRGAVGPCA